MSDNEYLERMLDKHTDQIAELKKAIGLLKEFQQGYIDRIINLEEVLRIIGNAVKDELDFYDEPEEREKIIKALEKLDSPKQTEKKDVKTFMDKFRKLGQKDSGGEKIPIGEDLLERIRKVESVPMDKSKLREKLPEPHRKWSLEENPCAQCKHEFPSITQRCKSCCNTEGFDGFEPKESEPEKYIENDLQIECPQCGWISEKFRVKIDPKREKELIEGFLRGLKGLIIEDDMEYFPKFQKDKYDQLIKEYEGMLK